MDYAGQFAQRIDAHVRVIGPLSTKDDTPRANTLMVGYIVPTPVSGRPN
jgi:hypothetical protein